MGRKKKEIEASIEIERTSPDSAGSELAPEKLKTRQKSYVLDLRIHSPASLGYLGVDGLDTAPALVRLAKVKGLDVIAVTDFYTGRFIDRVVAAAKELPLTVIPGTVVRAKVAGCNDVVLTCLFPETCSGADVDSFLREAGVPERAFGDRRYVLEKNLHEVLAVVEKFRGVALPSRMDKTPYRMAAIPTLVEEYRFRAFDLAYADSSRFFRLKWPKTKFQLFSFSNANALAQVGSRIAKVKMTVPGFEGIRMLVGRSPDTLQA